MCTQHKLAAIIYELLVFLGGNNTKNVCVQKSKMQYLSSIRCNQYNFYHAPFPVQLCTIAKSYVTQMIGYNKQKLSTIDQFTRNSKKFRNDMPRRKEYELVLFVLSNIYLWSSFLCLFVQQLITFLLEKSLRKPIPKNNNHLLRLLMLIKFIMKLFSLFDSRDKMIQFKWNNVCATISLFRRPLKCSRWLAETDVQSRYHVTQYRFPNLINKLQRTVLHLKPSTCSLSIPFKS